MVAVGTSRIAAMEMATEVVVAAAAVVVVVVEVDMGVGTAVINSSSTRPRRSRGNLRRRLDIPASVLACLRRRRVTSRAVVVTAAKGTATRVIAMTITHPASSREATRGATRASNTGPLRARAARTGVMTTDAAAVIGAGTIAIHIGSNVSGRWSRG